MLPRISLALPPVLEVRFVGRIMDSRLGLDLNMPADPQASHPKEDDRLRPPRFGPGSGVERPGTVLADVEVLPPYPLGPFVAVALARPAPELTEDAAIDEAEGSGPTDRWSDGP